MTENEEKLKKVSRNGGEPKETTEDAQLWQTTETPFTPEMMYKALREKYPALFADDSQFVKLEGGKVPTISTRRVVNQ
jgi:hypothetical protein